jgi:predicted SAM-dependent methyltransferase
MRPPTPPPATWKRRLVERAIPSNVLYPLKFELYAHQVRRRGRKVRRRFAGAQGLRVNVGAGSAGQPGWVNLDVMPRDGVTAVYDCRRNLPFPDGSVSMLFTEHFLEHLNFQDDVPVFLAECHRVLSAGGAMRVIVPDLAKYLEGYCTEGWAELERVRGMGSDHVDPWFGVPHRTKGEMVNFVARQWTPEPHLYFYDTETLTLALAGAGFHDVREHRPGETRVQGLALDLAERESESLRVEASK